MLKNPTQMKRTLSLVWIKHVERLLFDSLSFYSYNYVAVLIMCL